MGNLSKATPITGINPNAGFLQQQFVVKDMIPLVSVYTLLASRTQSSGYSNCGKISCLIEKLRQA